MELDCTAIFPLIIRKGINQSGKELTYYLNFSDEEITAVIKNAGTELFSNKAVGTGEKIVVPAWNLIIIEEL
ncbi:hypothetical protein [Butyrivibrio sp. AE3004]|uniref:hypothetical protein n=1 Tax=Butyrivibrio sp. AE3004 TaxID=1506994 RepID=UPI0004941244|nr:hypothetical protein [Butyrivibrio sp. AE3004]